MYQPDRVVTLDFLLNGFYELFRTGTQRFGHVVHTKGYFDPFVEKFKECFNIEIGVDRKN